MHVLCNIYEVSQEGEELASLRAKQIGKLVGCGCSLYSIFRRLLGVELLNALKFSCAALDFYLYFSHELFISICFNLQYC